MAAGYCYSLGIKSNNFFLKDNKKAFILWLNVPKVTAYNDHQRNWAGAYYWHNKEYDERQYRRFRCQAESLVILFYESILSGTLYDNHARTRYAKKIYGMIEELMNRDWSKMNETLK